MKKLAVILVASLGIINLTPAMGYCMQIDHFEIEKANITSVTGDGNLRVQQMNHTKFAAFCTDSSPNIFGNIYLGVSNDKNGTCSITMSSSHYDVPNVTSIICNGNIKFTDIHPNFEYSEYILEFN